MRSSTIIALIILFITLMSFQCRKEFPPDPEEYKFTINAKLNHITETIRLGDTLSIEVTLPDIITAYNYLNQVRTEETIILRSASFSYTVMLVDSVARTDRYLSFAKPDYNIYDYFTVDLRFGTTQYAPWEIFLQNTSRPYKAILNLIPKVKGIFYFRIAPNTSFNVNQNFKGKFIVHLPSDNHLDMVDRNIDNYQWREGVELNRSLGSETYAFRVN